MIINHTNHTTTNTDKLPDMEAMILEKAEEFRKLCTENCRQFVLIVDAKGSETGDGFQFWNLKQKSKEFDNPDNFREDGKVLTYSNDEIKKAFDDFISMIHSFVMRFTNGSYGIMDRQYVYSELGKIKSSLDAMEKYAKEHKFLISILEDIKNIDIDDPKWNGEWQSVGKYMQSLANDAINNLE